MTAPSAAGTERPRLFATLGLVLLFAMGLATSLVWSPPRWRKTPDRPARFLGLDQPAEPGARAH